MAKIKVPTRALFYAGTVLWGLVVMIGLVLIFFPYQKVLKIAAQNVLGANKMIVSVQGAHFGFNGFQASKILVGHPAVEGKPLIDLRAIDVTWSPLSLLTGALTIFSKATAYDGTVECTIAGVPVLLTANPDLRIRFNNVNLAKYPEGTLPWLNGLSGSMSGWIKKEVSLARPEKQKGSFRIIMTAGEMKELHVKNLERFVLAYKEIVAEGKISGSTILVDRIVVDGEGIRLKGSGTIEKAGSDKKINLKLLCENPSGAGPLPNGSVITVTGSHLAPTVSVSAEAPQLPEKQAARTGAESDQGRVKAAL
jgi:type II secretion system protein N